MRTAYARRPEPDLDDARIERELAAPDYCSKEGALKLKARIEAYWRERGRDVELRVVGEGVGPGMGVAFGLQSDIGDKGAAQ